ncbi:MULTISPECIES: SAM-dependent methyltransferase [unclassified Mesorhizobium]|uniref:SAM-dependent methyltransferase n=1 Tax=unclassified Mesorhizobium TaxID=325217 RepID=UPI001CD0F897|nr:MULTISPECIES: SAM-dependent methyltransferase [unclassified Mesorhizobium]MCA0025499.1 SAM-dependent methyltransferase [Mesorhizobium sp. B263B1A]
MTAIVEAFDASGLQQVVERARALLDDGDVAAARMLAAGVYDQAKAGAAFAARFGAAERLVLKARRLQGDALLIEARAKVRLADEYDAAQANGEASKGRPKTIPDGKTFTQEEAGLSAKEVHEARKLRDAELRQPGIVERAIAARLMAGLEPSRANLRAAVGTDSATAAERGNNLYETPPEAMRTLLSLTRFSRRVWEPACGKGAISRMLEDAGYEVEISDLVDYGTSDSHGEVQRVENFLASTPRGQDPARPDIVTNPPYGTELNAFVAHALRAHRPRRMALLLNLNFLCGFDDPDRCLAMDEMPPSDVYVFTRRLPMMHRDGWNGPEASSRMNTAWFVWTLDEATGTYDADGKRGTQLARVDWKTFEGSTLIGPAPDGETSELPISPLEGEMAGRPEGGAAPPTFEVDPKLIETVAVGMQTETGRKALVKALDVIIAAEEAPKPKRGRPRKAVPA